MSSHKKSLEHGKFNQSQLPTATKTNYYEASQVINTTSFKSPNKFIQSKVQGFKESIGSIIDQMSYKQHLNFEAIQKIDDLNLDAMSLAKSYVAPGLPQKWQKTTAKRQNQAMGPTTNSWYHQNAQEPAHPQEDENVYKFPQFKNLEQENSELRKALNHQMRVSAELRNRVHYLEMENNDLRAELNHKDSKLTSTKHMSQNLGGHSLNNIWDLSSGKDNQSYEHIRNSSQNLQPRLSPFKSKESIEINNEISQIFADLQELKRENDQLRHNAVRLLQ